MTTITSLSHAIFYWWWIFCWFIFLSSPFSLYSVLYKFGGIPQHVTILLINTRLLTTKMKITNFKMRKICFFLIMEFAVLILMATIFILKVKYLDYPPCVSRQSKVSSCLFFLYIFHTHTRLLFISLHLLVIRRCLFKCSRNLVVLFSSHFCCHPHIIIRSKPQQHSNMFHTTKSASKKFDFKL